MKNLFIILFFNISFILCSVTNNYNSIFYFAKSPKTNSLSSIHFISSNISEIFYQPISNKKNINNDYYFSITNQFNNQIGIMQFAYCIKHNNDKNISVGFVKRNIKNIYNTTDAWNTQDFLIPEFNNIDYEQISNASYQHIGFVISYNRYFKKTDLSIKLKPFYNSIDSNKALGIDADLITNYKIENSNIDIIIGINNIISYKKWNTDSIEKNKKEYFLSTNINLNKINLYFESDNIYNEKIAFEYKIQDFFYVRLGKYMKTSYTSGFGLYSNFVELNYAYLNHNKLGNSYQISILFKLDNILSLKNNLNS